MRSLFTAIALVTLFAINGADVSAELKAGAAVVDVTPAKLPVLVNGGMTSRSTSTVTTRINARAIVVDDGKERIGIVVVDSCMMPRPLLDEAKQLASMQTGLKPNRILISATHSHTAPSSMGALGTEADQDYLPVLRAGIAEALVKAEANLEPAKVGWGVENAEDFTALRRWIRRPDRLAADPFGNLTVRANMHSGADPNVVTGESGPEDPDLSLISFQAISGRPIAVLANFSMHYFSGQTGLAADYFGLFSEGLKDRLSKDNGDHPPFVGMMSHGCSGDIWRRDYTKPADQQNPFKDINEYAAGLLDIAMKAYESIEYRADADLGMSEARQVLKYRVPTQQRLEWAKAVMEEHGDKPLLATKEIYAREQIILHERQETEVVVQGIRIGDIGIGTTANETYALTGLKVKNQSPLKKTMVIELANGGDGYIPPPEQHVLGGYNTWPARSAGLEVRAEPIIAETVLSMLEIAAGAPRRPYQQSQGKAAAFIASAKPAAWWRMDEMAGPWAMDSSGNGRNAMYEIAVAYFLEGPHSKQFCQGGETNRSAHFAGGRMLAELPDVGQKYSVSFWAWNGMPTDAREIAGWMVSRGRADFAGANSEHLGIAGTAHKSGHLVYKAGAEFSLGKTVVPRWTWTHVTLVRNGNQIQAYLNGELDLEMTTTAKTAGLPMFLAGRSDNKANWEGRLDEIAVFDRILTAEEIHNLAVAP